jgi:hypothetical protein
MPSIFAKEHLIPAREAADFIRERLGSGLNWAYFLVDNRRSQTREPLIPFVRSGRSVFYRIRDLTAFVDRKRGNRP